MTHADDLQAVSVDEALVDVTNSVARLTKEKPSTPDPAKALAETIRSETKKATGCEGLISCFPRLINAKYSLFILQSV
jgi:DNA repair protein REV1